MERKLNKEGFLDAIFKIRSVAKRRKYHTTDGFYYLNDIIVKRLAENKNFRVADLDFSKFTEEDIDEYLRYYNEVLGPKINILGRFKTVINEAGNVMSAESVFY